MRLPFFQVDAFASVPFTGNPAAVVPLKRWLADDLLQGIAAENNLAETAYYIPFDGDEADYELRWFTPTCEIRLCGHATLASGHVTLSADPERETIRFRTRKAGIMTVARSGEGYALDLVANPTAPSHHPEAEAALGIGAVEVESHPDRYHLFRLADEAAVRAVDPDFRALAALGDDQFIVTAPGDAHDVVSRVFVPGAGVDEDPVTGSAHSVLTPYWTKRLGRGHFTAFQASRRGGVVQCELRGDRVQLSGGCVTVIEGEIVLPD